jgi:hypothetical protein
MVAGTPFIDSPNAWLITTLSPSVTLTMTARRCSVFVASCTMFVMADA